MKIHCFVFALVITFLLPCLSHSAIFCVTNTTELQDALTTAASNAEDDTIQIEQGTYAGNFIYASLEAFSLTVEGGYTSGCGSRDVDPANTILDGNATGSVLVFSTPDTEANLEVDGLTLQNGVADSAGGLNANTEGDITITNNIITGNTAKYSGGGVQAYSEGSITFTNNIITGNTAKYSGGGVWAWSNTYSEGSITFTNNTITGNTADWDGGGVLAHAAYDPNADVVGSITFTNNTITGNTTNRRGGGVNANSEGSITFTNNTITGNTADWDGGGVYAYSYSYSEGSITFTNNTITGNTANSGGGVWAVSDYSRGSITFTNNSITENTADLEGGGVLAISVGSITFTNNSITENFAGYGGGVGAHPSSSISYTNNTITGNTANHNGGGFYLGLYFDSALADIINNIIWNNNATDSGNDLYIHNDGNGNYFPSTVNLYNNDFDQSAEGTYIQLSFAIDSSNLDNEDPLFTDALSGNYHINASSPCIDTGRLEGAPADDMDAEPRPMGYGVDIGADEYTSFIPTTTSSATTTTAEPTTSTSSSSTTTSIEPTTSSSSTTSSSPYQPPPNTTTSIETTSSSTSTSSATTTEPTTTTSTEECSINIEPQTDEVVSKQSLTFTVNATGDCNDSDYEWSVDSKIRSSCNQSGNYTAGINFDMFNPATDIVSVIDHGNDDITAEAAVTVSFGCPSMQIYGEQSKEVELLRYFRDNVLSQTPEGQELIRLYYQWSPVIVKAMEEDEEFKEEIREMIEGILPLIRGEA